MSKTDLKELIDILKKEALQEADQAAQKITEQAQERARQIESEAGAKAESILSSAQSEADAYHASKEESLRLASRDLLISTKNNMIELLSSLLEKEVEHKLDQGLWEQIIMHVVENLGSNTLLSISHDTAQKLTDLLIGKLQQNDQVSILSAQEGGQASIHIKKVDKGWSYEISPRVVAQLLQDRLGPEWNDYLGGKTGSK